MYNAPAVSYPVGRSYIKRVITWAILLLALGVLGFWCHQVPRLAWPQGLGLGLWLVSGVLAVRDDLDSPQGHLSWDGRVWLLASTGQSWLVEVRPQLDAQRLMLLELKTAPMGFQWLWLERETDPLNWDALRRAVWAQDKTEMANTENKLGLVADQP